MRSRDCKRRAAFHHDRKSRKFKTKTPVGRITRLSLEPVSGPNVTTTCCLSFSDLSISPIFFAEKQCGVEIKKCDPPTVKGTVAGDFLASVFFMDLLCMGEAKRIFLSFSFS
jgi:hypothetical protein